MLTFVFYLLLKFSLLHNIIPIVYDLKNVDIVLKYKDFENNIKLLDETDFLQNYYEQNLQNIASIEVDSGCDSKVFQVKIKDISKNNRKILNYYLRCFLENRKRYTSAKIVTNKIYFRLHNIKVALKHLDGLIWKKGERFDTVEFLSNYENEYINGESIYNGKVVMIKGGGLCGFATALYQLGVKTKGIKILERHPHTYFYRHYYNLTGLDATVFFMSGIVKNLILENDFYDGFFKTYWKETKKNFIYEIRFYSLKVPVENRIEIGKVYLSGGKQCVDVFVENDKLKDKITSCYKGIFR